MEPSITQSDRSVAALIHLSTLSQFFFPFGNFLFPLILWMIRREDPFVNEHGKQALNFQICMYLYYCILITAGISAVLIVAANSGGIAFFHDPEDFLFPMPGQASPVFFVLVIFLLLILPLFALQIFAVVAATIRAAEGKEYTYPLAIRFLTRAPVRDQEPRVDTHKNDKNESI